MAKTRCSCSAAQLVTLVTLVVEQVVITRIVMRAGPTTILGFGSLLSEQSARTTFPDLNMFRLVRVRDYRRVFAHAAAIFFERGIADESTFEFASLSAEPHAGGSFVACAFEVDLDAESWARFEAREEEFDLRPVPFADLAGGAGGEGILCARSSDADYVARWGQARFDADYASRVPSIWDWAPDSGLRPCACYLRHCVLAVTKAGAVARDSFLDETLLVDRTTTVREYLSANPQVMDTRPPPSLEGRYSG